MEKRPIAIYLDASDYSYLTDPRRHFEYSRLREQLEDLARSGRVQFFYSGAMLSEIAPVREMDRELATLRGGLLAKLCGQNAMAAFDRVVSGELDQLYGAPINRDLARRFDGEWFPDIGVLMPSPSARSEMMLTTLEKTLAEAAPNRKTRRAARRKAIGKHGIRPGILPVPDPIGLELGSLPIRPADYAVVVEYLAGRATRMQADAAMKASLRDSAWIVLYLTSSEGSATRLAEMIRKPAEVAIGKLNETLLSLVERLRGIRSVDPNFEISPELWGEAWDSQLSSVARKLDEKMRFPTTSQNALLIEKSCPGMTCFFWVAFELLKRRIIGNGKPMTRNDFQDASHALYAPYVDVFRADGNTASLLRSHAKRYRTIVVDKVTQLPDAIQRATLAMQSIP